MVTVRAEYVIFVKASDFPMVKSTTGHSINLVLAMFKQPQLRAQSDLKKKIKIKKVYIKI